VSITPAARPSGGKQGDTRRPTSTRRLNVTRGTTARTWGDRPEPRHPPDRGARQAFEASLARPPQAGSSSCLPRRPGLASPASTPMAKAETRRENYDTLATMEAMGQQSRLGTERGANSVYKEDASRWMTLDRGALTNRRSCRQEAHTMALPPIARNRRVLGIVALIVIVLPGCANSGVAGSSTRIRPANNEALPPASGHPLPTIQRTVRFTKTPKVPPGVTPTSTSASEARLSTGERSITPGATRPVLALASIGTVYVSCSEHPKIAVKLTKFVADEGPPTVAAYASATSGQVGLPLDDDQLKPAESHGPQQFVFRQVSGASEAFTYQATLWLLVTPTRSRCDVLAQAEVHTTGPFYTWAHKTQIP
jgi:hypothetical protein